MKSPEINIFLLRIRTTSTFSFFSGGRLHIRVDQSGKTNDGCDPDTKTLIKLNQMTKISITVGKEHMEFQKLQKFRETISFQSRALAKSCSVLMIN